jgi:hypothetical protein
VVIKEETWWNQIAPVLKIVHRPLPSLTNANSKDSGTKAAATVNQKAAQRLAGADKAALKIPKNALEAFCSANGVDVAQRIKTVHSWPQHIPTSVLSEGKGGKGRKGKGPVKGAGEKQSTLVETMGKERAEGLLKEVTDWLGVCLPALLSLITQR